MYLHVQQLINQIETDEPDPAAANALQEGLGGQFGEMRTMMQYLFQSFNFRGRDKLRPYYDLIANIATEELGQNALVIRVQPDEGMTIRFGSKVPGTAMEIRDVNMDFAYGGSFTESSPEAYERLILDVLLGEPPLFPRHEEVELSWRILDPIEEFWAERSKPVPYLPGSWGPPEADEMLARDGGRTWRRP